jgi:hypothetical protein
MIDAESLDDAERTFVAALTAASPEIRAARELAGTTPDTTPAAQVSWPYARGRPPYRPVEWTTMAPAGP